VGSVVLAIHDASDVFLEIGKLTKYYGWEIVPSIVFVIFAISWVVLRLIYFPLHVIWSTRYVFSLLLACT
jgi:ceramide synthetase